MLRDVSCVDLRTSILGREVAFPVGIAATGSHRMAHSDGERATARGLCINTKRNQFYGASGERSCVSCPITALSLSGESARHRKLL